MSKPEVNVLVGGPINGVAPCQYKTKILKANLSFKGQVENDPNTKFIIKWDFDLRGGSVTIPENCILKFDGGSLNGGIVILSNTLLQGNIKILSDVSGSVLNGYIDPTWFGADNTGTVDSYRSIQLAIDIAGNSNCNKVFVPSGTFLISQPLKVYREKNIDFCGAGINNYGKTIIKAMAEMPCMITTGTLSSGAYISSSFHDFELEGNRTGEIYDNGSFNYDSTALAKGGFYFPYGYIYTSIKNVILRNIDGWGVRCASNWGVLYDRVTFYECESGILSSGGNGTSIKNCEFTRTSRICVATSSAHDFSVIDNIFEVVGECSVICSNSTVHIRNNEFEYQSVTGMNFTALNGYNIDNIHSAILCLGSDTSLYVTKQEHYPLNRAYPGTVSVMHNDFQHDMSSIVFASSMNGGEISDNVLHGGDDIPVLGTILDSNSCIIRNISISRNVRKQGTSYTGLLPKISIAATRPYADEQYRTSLINITSDDPQNGLLSENITNSLVLISNKLLVEQEDRYLNMRTFKAMADDTLFELYYKFLDYFTRLDTDMLDNKVLEAQFYYKTPTGSWEKVNRNIQNLDFTYYVGKDCLITLPTIFASGENRCDVREYEPVCGGYLLSYPPYVHYLPNTLMRALDNKWVEGVVCTYNSNDPGNTLVPKAVSRNLVGEITELRNEVVYASEMYDGVSIIQVSTGKQIHWSNSRSSWLGEDGFTAVADKGPTGNRPTGKHVVEEVTYGDLDAVYDIGFEYFDTTIGMPIYATEIDQSTGAVTWKTAAGENA